MYLLLYLRSDSEGKMTEKNKGENLTVKVRNCMYLYRYIAGEVKFLPPRLRKLVRPHYTEKGIHTLISPIETKCHLTKRECNRNYHLPDHLITHSSFEGYILIRWELCPSYKSIIREYTGKIINKDEFGGVLTMDIENSTKGVRSKEERDETKEVSIKRRENEFWEENVPE